MKFALLNDKKIEATKGAKGFCPSCGSELIAKCGEIKVNHWAHKGNRNCDPWWENETEWHRSWKNQFPSQWQEVVHFSDNGERHIADVKTQTDWVLEFQHSFLNAEERHSRNSFYVKLIWIVDGARRKTDIPQFEEALRGGNVLANHAPLQIRLIHFPQECRLIREWHNDDALVFFDFQQTQEVSQSVLWLLFPRISDSVAFISTFPRRLFVELHNTNGFDQVLKDTILPLHQELIMMEKRRRKSYY